ncbi:DUF6153 family protein [Streptomyces sp. NPDC127084]|uniref:DUF6153 family protein n=1 Tax=Streptomyces sp. NPDC127084 TaxID=3347133 RepID=UPI003668DE1C
MGLVSFAAPSTDHRAGRVFALLVMVVLAGVLGMHALAPGGVPTAQAVSGHDMVTHPTTAVPEASPGCSHTDGGNHLDHADAMCAAAGIGSPYAPPALPAAVGAVPTATALNGLDETAVTGRAPPDLSKLQLLRI